MSKNIILIDIGLRTTDVSFLKGDTILHEFVIHQAGDAITRAIATRLGISLDEAAEVKHAAELSGSNKKGKKAGTRTPMVGDAKKVRASIEPIIKAILEEVQTATKEIAVQHRFAPEQCVLIGGSSALKGIQQYSENILKIPTIIGDPVAYSYSAFMTASDDSAKGDPNNGAPTDRPLATPRSSHAFVTPLTSFFTGILVGMMITYVLLGAIGR